MDLDALWRQGLEIARERWLTALLPVASLLIGLWWGRRRARREWRQKQFLSRVNVSLNTFAERPDGGLLLQIRTLSEKDALEVFLNQIAVERVQAATTRTSESDPLLPLGDDAWYLLNAVLNEVSEQFAAGHVRRDLGASVTTGRYLIALTYEHAGDIRTQKVRAMVIRKDRLEALFLPPVTPREGEAAPPAPPTVHIERPNHATRLRTLGQLAAAHRRDPSQFLEVEISV